MQSFTVRGYWVCIYINWLLTVDESGERQTNNTKESGERQANNTNTSFSDFWFWLEVFFFLGVLAIERIPAFYPFSVTNQFLCSS